MITSVIDRLRLLFLAFFLALFVLPPLLCFADDAGEDSKDEPPNFTYHDVKTKEGLVFRVPEDMPIVKRGGILAPLPFDEYVYRKLKQMDNHIKRIESRIEAVEKKIALHKQEKTAGTP